MSLNNTVSKTLFNYINFKICLFLDHSIVANLGVSILTNLMPKMYPILERFPNIAMNYYKSLNCFVELLVCNNEVSEKSICRVIAFN